MFSPLYKLYIKLFVYCCCSSGQTTNREPHLSADNWIKDLLSMALSTRTRPGFPTTSSSHQEAGTSLLSSSIRGQTEEVWTITPQPPEQKPQSQKANQNDHMDHSLVKSMKLWDMPCRATQNGQVMVETSDKTWSTGEGNGKPLQYYCLENAMNSMCMYVYIYV